MKNTLEQEATAFSGQPIFFERKMYSNEILIGLYKSILLPRMIEEKMLVNLRLGKITKWFSGIGQEAISVGVTKAMDPEEYILPMHRNLGVFTSRGMPLNRLFMQLQGSASGYSKGRERSFHFGSNEHHIGGMISHIGPQMGIADGIALAEMFISKGHNPLSTNGKNEKKELNITAVFTGDGGTSEGDFHEAMNVAAVWDLPVIFVIENNSYGLSTPLSEQYKCKDLVDKAVGYGMEAYKIDGNNILEVYDRVMTLRSSMKRHPRPVLIECITFRMRGHEEASGTKYVPNHLFDQWEKKDPVKNYEKYLLAEGVLKDSQIQLIKGKYKIEIEKALEAAFSQPKIKPDTELEIKDVFAPYVQKVIEPAGKTKSKKRFVDAISDGLREAMKKFDNLILMGQDIAEYGGVFKVTENFYKEFGKERVRNTPLCESAIVGAALGLSIKGYKSMVEMQFADFVTCGFNQVINNLAKIHYRWGQNADVVIRMPCGGGVGAGPFHSQSNEAWFTHTPGLKVVYPSTPYDAKGLMIASIEDPNPVMFFEHKALYRSISEEIPDGYYTVEIGKARRVLEGNDVSIITYGMGVRWTLDTLKENPGISADVIDLRTLAPLDYDAISESVKKTGKAIVLHEDTLTGGIGGDIAAWISANCFEYLDAPVMRSASLDTPVPFAAELEKNFFPKDRFKKQLKELIDY
jgi:2-oxoisovalerate dehydrogenase E1 component